MVCLGEGWVGYIEEVTEIQHDLCNDYYAFLLIVEVTDVFLFFFRKFRFP